MVAVAAKAEGGSQEMGFVVPSFERGALLLKNSDGKIYRLSWLEDGDASKAAAAQKVAAAERRRALPAGDYTLVGYRLCRDDAEGVRWDLSATGPEMRTLKVKAGRALKVEIEQKVYFRHHRPPGSFGVNIYGDDQAGIAIYRDGVRIPIGFELRDALGQVRFKGRVNYG